MLFIVSSLTSSSGATSIWRKDSRRRLKRFDYLSNIFINISHNNVNAQVNLQDCLFALGQLLLFLKGFTESERNKLAMLTGILLANGNLSAAILSSLFNENLVKEGTVFHLVGVSR